MSPLLHLLTTLLPAALAAGAEIPYSCPLPSVRFAIQGSLAGHDGAVGQFPLWVGSMMPHASRDPYWRAKLRDCNYPEGSGDHRGQVSPLPCSFPAISLPRWILLFSSIRTLLVIDEQRTVYLRHRVALVTARLENVLPTAGISE